MMNQGRARPKYIISCIIKDMMPVARVSFCIKTYQVAHNLSAMLRCTLYLDNSSNWPQYDSCELEKRVEVVFLGRVCISFKLIDSTRGRGRILLYKFILLSRDWRRNECRWTVFEVRILC